jgi:hypothetical protein
MMQVSAKRLLPLLQRVVAKHAPDAEEAVAVLDEETLAALLAPAEAPPVLAEGTSHFGPGGGWEHILPILPPLISAVAEIAKRWPPAPPKPAEKTAESAGQAVFDESDARAILMAKLTKVLPASQAQKLCDEYFAQLLQCIEPKR